MKKSVLALLCLICGFGFTSCIDEIENPEPSIEFVAGEGYISADTDWESETPFMLGVTAKSNTQTAKKLTSFNLTMTSDSEVIYDTTYAIANQDSYSYDVQWELSGEGVVTIQATVVDEAGKQNSVVLNINLVKTEQPLEAAAFEWKRVGGTPGTGLEEFGLQWTGNVKLVNAVIKPLEGVEMFILNGFDFSADLTATAKTEAINAGEKINDFRGVSADASKDYDFVIATRKASGEEYIIHITRGDVSTITGVGTQIIITGEYK